MVSDFIYLEKGTNANAVLKMWNVIVPTGNREKREHSHTAMEISLFKRGSGIYNVEGKEYSFCEGDVVIFCSNEHHCITKVNEELKILNFQFEPRLLWGTKYDSLSETAQSLCFFHRKEFNSVVHDTDFAKELKKYLLSIEEEFTEKKPEYCFAIKNILNNMMLAIVRNGNYLDKGVAAVETSHLRTMRKTMDYIENNLTEPLYLEEIAAKQGISPSYFSTLFKKVTGTTLTRYINERRIGLALHLLSVNSDDTMLGIAVKCGYNNTANFNKAFRSITGVTPTEYKKYGGVPLS